jgi:DNA polymerase (family 10)
VTNDQIAAHFSLLADLLDVHGENPFKTKSYSSAAYAIERLPKEIVEMSEGELASVRGIGEAIRSKIGELLQTGTLAALQKVEDATPQGILEMLRIKGLGPKKIAVIWKELGIETLGELEYACTEHRLSGLKGFGAKTEANICEAIQFFQQSQGFHLFARAEAVADKILERLRTLFPEARFEITGEMRRQAEVVSGIDLLTTASEHDLRGTFEEVVDATMEWDEDGRILSVRLPGYPLLRLHGTNNTGFGTALFRTTGGAAFLEAFAEKYPVLEATEREEEIFEKAGIAVIHPALREDAGVLAEARAGSGSGLIQPEDIRGIIHSHSTWSDGANSIEEMARGAMALGLEYLVISDHSQAAFYANGLTPDRVAAQHAEVDALNEKLAPFRIFKSIEADILADGSLDYGPHVLSTFDLVIASVHSNLKMPQEKAMERLLSAIRNPYTATLGHMTGRLLLSRPGYPVDHEAIIDACAEHDVVIEINANPRRLDMDWRWIPYAVERGVMLSINPDAHSVAGFGDVRYGVLAAQKGGLRREGNLSSWGLEEMEAWVERVKGKRDI